MPRASRKKSSTNVYHVILRGNNKQDIFFDEKDYKKFLKEIKNTKEKYEYELYAYCLMTNHVHLILYDRKENLSKIMQSLEVTYSSYFSKKYEKVGHLFQNRFLSKPVETKEYLMQVCRYIHQNPVKAGISSVDDYKWSSYNEYIDSKKVIVSTKILLSLFGNSEKEAIKHFQGFHNDNKENINDEYEYEIITKFTDEEAKIKIMEVLKLENLEEINNFSVKLRNEKIRKLEDIKGISKAQVARVLGTCNRTIERITKK